VVLVLALLAICVLSTHVGSTNLGQAGSITVGETLRGLLASIGFGEGSSGRVQGIVTLRLRRTLIGVGVGAALAYSGTLLQGVFRNGLASPSVLGVTSGASLGAAIAVLVVDGYGPDFLADRVGAFAPAFVTALGFAGALAVVGAVTWLATSAGRLSIPTLLLVGIAANLLLGGLIAALQSLVLADNFDAARAIFAWTFGSLTDRTEGQVATVFGGLALALLALPFVARELDLFAGGEEDAQALGVATGRVKLLAISAAALAAAAAVAVAGQIAFVGLIVPHLLRICTGSSYRSLLPLSLVGGAAFLLGADLLQRLVLRDTPLQPGVMMSLVGGPFFLFILIRHRKGLRTW
jgi:iron complex transport system permease protein